MQRIISKAHTLPSSFYTCPKHFQKELETVFRSNWLHVGRLDQVPNVGDYFAGKLHRQPFVVARSDGGVRAFDNVCRHHGTILVKDSGNLAKKCITCPYHSWTYNLDGRLIRATRVKGIEDFRAKDYGLHQLPMKTLGERLIFLHFGVPDPTTNFDEKFVQIENDYPQLRFVKTKTYELNCNWKVFVDNYLDGGYHVEYAHRDLAANLDMKSYQTAVFDRHSVQSVGNAPVQTGENDGGQQNRFSKPASYTWIYPNLMLNRYGKWLDTNTVYPIDAERCAVVYDWYIEKEDDDPQAGQETIEQDLNKSNQVQEEDEILCAQVQEGMHSRFFHQGRYAPKVEMAMYHFHDLLLKDLDMTVTNC